jgi:hypothetical protein
LSDTAKKHLQPLAVIFGSIEIKSERRIIQLATEDGYLGKIQEAPQILSSRISQFPECGFWQQYRMAAMPTLTWETNGAWVRGTEVQDTPERFTAYMRLVSEDNGPMGQAVLPPVPTGRALY